MNQVKHILLTIIASAMVIPTAAQAQDDVHTNVHRLLIRDGNNAGEYRRDEDGRDRPRRQRGTGQEQIQMAQLADGSLMSFGIGSYEINGELPNNRIQNLCTHIRLDPVAGPVVQTMEYVTDLDGDRYRNGMHPRVTPIFNGTVVAVTWNYAPNNHAYTYTTVFGPGCEQLSEMTKIMDKNNDNCSENKEPGVVVEQTASEARIVEMHGCNGNGRDDAWIAGVSITKELDNSYTVTKEYDYSIEANEERSRGTVMLTGEPNFAVACWTAGNTQPPNKGVRCAGIDTAKETPEGGNDERILWREYVAERDGDIYRTEIRSTVVMNGVGQPTDKIMVNYTESNKRRRRGKGAQTLISNVIKATPLGMTVMRTPQLNVFPTADATHGNMCNTMWGKDGEEQAKGIIMATSVNGNTSASALLQIVRWDEAQSTYIAERRINTGAAIDNAWIPNIYGNNPNNQGRNFIQCVGNVRNPGYMVDGGFMSNVKSFIAIPATTRRMDPLTELPEEKLATELVLIPAVVSPQSEELPPDDVIPDGEGGSGGNTDPDNTGSGSGSSGGVGGCAIDTHTSSLPSFLFLALAVLPFARRRRRRRG